QNHKKARISANIRNRLEGEVISKYWSMINKPQKPRDVIHRLRKPPNPNQPNTGTAIYESDSRRMANIARNHHNNIQNERRDSTEDERKQTIQRVLSRTARHLSPEQIELLKKKLTREDIVEAMKASANDKAPG
ncbi:hypothetical protein R3P38DRAFT_2449212, partial [Favolaschia claudopus]